MMMANNVRFYFMSHTSRNWSELVNKALQVTDISSLPLIVYDGPQLPYLAHILKAEMKPSIRLEST